MIVGHALAVALRARALVWWVAPFLAVATLTAVMVGMGIITLVVISERDDEAAARRAVQEQTLINRRLIERGNPCLPADPPGSEACVAARAVEERLRVALAAVQAQHDAQAIQVADLGDRLIELQLRNHGSTINAGSTPRPPLRPPPRITDMAPPAESTTTTTVVTTTTECRPPGCKAKK